MFKFFNGGCELRTCGEEGLALDTERVIMQEIEPTKLLLLKPRN